MKSHLIILMLVATGALSASEPAARPLARPRLTDEMRHNAMDLSSGVRDERPTGGSSGDVLMMAPFGIVETTPRPSNEPENLIPPTLRFSPLDGGTYLKRVGAHFTTELKLQYDPGLRGWDLLKITW